MKDDSRIYEKREINITIIEEPSEIEIIKDI